MAPSALLPEPIPNLISPNTKYNDFRDDLYTNGYAVIKNAIPLSRATSYQDAALSWLDLQSSPEFSRTKPSTWTADILPVQSSINTFVAYGVSHEKFMWDVRLEDNVIDAFAKIWGTKELLVSFDALNITFPNRIDVHRKEPWEHIDQNPRRRGLHCVQGIVQLSEAGPEDGGLMVYPGTHKLTSEFFDTQTDPNTWDTRDYYPFHSSLSYFTSRGIKPTKVCASPGDLILWDSRTIHYGTEPSPLSNTIRTIIYVAYTPVRLATKEALEMKRQIFEEFGGTTHWPHENINRRIMVATRKDGSVCTRDRKEPRTKPERTDKLLQLAGVLPY